MQAVRKRKLVILILMLSVVSIVVALVLYALGQNINLFYSPTQIVAGEAPLQHSIRIGGMVEKNSLIRKTESLEVQFKLTDFKQSIQVSYVGILPDLFREGQGVVAEGVLLNQGHFKAERVLAKHDENYMPPEVKAVLATEGRS